MWTNWNSMLICIKFHCGRKKNFNKLFFSPGHLILGNLQWTSDVFLVNLKHSTMCWEQPQMQWYHGLPVFTFFSCTGGSFFCFEKVHWSNCLWLQDIYSPYRFFFQDTTLLSVLWFMSHFFWDVWLKFSCPKPVQVNNLNLPLFPRFPSAPRDRNLCLWFHLYFSFRFRIQDIFSTYSIFLRAHVTQKYGDSGLS